jgi:hypothetical protein
MSADWCCIAWLENPFLTATGFGQPGPDDEASASEPDSCCGGGIAENVERNAKILPEEIFWSKNILSIWHYVLPLAGENKIPSQIMYRILWSIVHGFFTLKIMLKYSLHTIHGR